MCLSKSLSLQYFLKHLKQKKHRNVQGPNSLPNYFLRGSSVPVQCLFPPFVRGAASPRSQLSHPSPHTISQIYILHYIHKFSTQQCNKKSYDLELTSIYRNFVFRSSRFLSTLLYLCSAAAAAAAASHSKAAAITQYASQKMLLHPATTSSIQHPLGKKSCGTKQVAAMHYIKL